MKIRFDPSITYGNLLQTLVLVLGLLGAWINMQVTLDTTATRVKAHELAVQQLRATDAKLAETQTRMTENLQVLTAIVEERTGHRINPGSK